MIFDSYKTAKDIFNHFDFTICMAAIDLDTGKMHKHKDFLKHNSQRFLKFNDKTKFPYASARRVEKYKERGYTIGNLEQMKILMACADKKITSWEEFKTQIGGVYGEALDIPEDKKFNKKNLNKALESLRPLHPLDVDEKYHYIDEDKCLWLYGDKKGKKFTCNDGKDYYDFGDGWDLGIPDYVDLEELESQGKIKETSLEKEYGKHFYKVVSVNSGGTDDFRSIHDSKFKYNIGSEVSSESPFIFVTHKDKLTNITYSDRLKANPNNYAIIKLKAKPEDIILTRSSSDVKHITLKRAKVVCEMDFEILDTGDNLFGSKEIKLKGKKKITAPAASSVPAPVTVSPIPVAPVKPF